ncbi:MAG: M48 family metallopeptidase [Candidatus Shapirobacteria bacterium]|jgi:heat shock protein HtpX
MQNVYEQVEANKTKSIVIVALFTAFIVGAAYLIGQSLGDANILPIALAFSLISSVGSYFYGPNLVLSLNGAKPAARKEFFDFYTVTENLALAAQIPVPQIYVIDSPAPNAFATGRDPKHAYVCATTGLLTKLNRTELEGVVAHELSHIKNYDTRLMTIVAVLIGTLSLFTNLAFRNSMYRDSDSDRKSGTPAIIGLVLIIFSPIIAQLIQLAISRRREYLADASAVMLTRQPSGLINALKIISADATKFSQASTATAPLYISNPFRGNKIASLFSTHPPLNERIKALESML